MVTFDKRAGGVQDRDMEDERTVYPEADRIRALMRRQEDAEVRELPDVPEDASLEERARVYEPLAMEALAIVVLDRKAPPAAKVSAANAIMDRSRGKPQQEVKHVVDGSGLLEMLEGIRATRLRLYENVEEAVLIPQATPP